jgi:putative spermidine/putrescine transport system permease protein
VKRRGRLVWWLVVIVGILYFFVPLFATLLFSLRARPTLAAYTNVLRDPNFANSLLYSFVIALITIACSIAIVVPTAFWVRLRLPRWRPVVELITLLPFVIPPVILVFGLIRSYSSGPLALTGTETGSSALLVAAYTVLSLPYMYRAVDVGLRSMDLQLLTEAAQNLGAGWLRILWQVVLPNLRVSLIGGAFLTLAIVIGEFTIASFLARPAFGPYLSLLGQNRAYEPAAVSLISFGITWLAMGLIQLLGRGRGARVPLAGAH